MEASLVNVQSEQVKDGIHLTLPLPPSINRLYRNFRGRTVLSAEGRDYKRAISENITIIRPYTRPVSIVVKIYMERLGCDLDNRLKALLDSVNGLVWVDDKQVEEIYTYRLLDRANPRVEMWVLEKTGNE